MAALRPLLGYLFEHVEEKPSPPRSRTGAASTGVHPESRNAWPRFEAAQRRLGPRPSAG